MIGYLFLESEEDMRKGLSMR